MKLKYYLRGVGVGLILAVAIYSTIIMPKKYEMTDAEIMDRARELGMVLQEEPDIDLSALSGTPSPTGEAGLTPVPSDGADLTLAPSGGEDLTPTPSVEADLTPTPSAEADLTPTPPGQEAPTPSGEEVLTPTPSGGEDLTLPPTEGGEPTQEASATSAPESEKVTLTITYGMGSEVVAYEAHRLGLVDDAMAFDRYLMQNGYSQYIRPGTYQIPKGATYEEIAKRVAMLPEG